MVNVWLVVADPERRSWLERLVQYDSELKLVGSSKEHPADCNDRPPVDIFLVDLAHERACHPQFWAAFRVLWPASRLAAITDMPVQPASLGAALNAGAYSMVSWEEQPYRVLNAIHSVATGEGFIPLGDVLEAIAQFFSLEHNPRYRVSTGDLEVDARSRRAFRRGDEVRLSRLEFDLLVFLAANSDRVFTTAELAQAVWGQPNIEEMPALQVKHVIQRLRRKLEPDPRHPQYVLNRHGQGYWMPRSCFATDLVFSNQA